MTRHLVPILTLLVAPNLAGAQHELPLIPPGFQVKLLATEPAIRDPASMAFDARGRLFVGQGPQFRHPRPDTPGDSIQILIDANDDGEVDQVKSFATGFNCILSLAWKGNDLWVANSPDLTMVRDTDGDDEADVYIRVYTDLGNLEHGLHGLTWGPDGKLYMSKGNSKGLTRGDRIAPRPFRDLWGVKSPPGAPDLPPIQVYRKGEYQKNYHDPADDWGREGGVLRCDDMGQNLEIVSRGMRNPYDIAFDDGFNWLGTDNDQTGGDRVFMPFYGAHFGWGHSWSYHWTGENHPPTAPISAPLFEGSGTGIVFYSSSQFPKEYRGVYFINDWGRNMVYVYRPRWDGALMQPAGGDLETFAEAGRSLFKPTDIEVGPDGALYILGWGVQYGVDWQGNTKNQGNAGRVFKIWHEKSPLIPRADWMPAKRSKPYSQWTSAELIEDLGHQGPVWRVDAQAELVRRGAAIKPDLLAALNKEGLPMAQETWLLWTLGRIAPDDDSIDQFFARQHQSQVNLNRRIQALRILAYRIRQFGKQKELPDSVTQALCDPEPRIRFEVVQAARQAGQRQLLEQLKQRAASEFERLTFYALWGTLGDFCSVETLKEMLADARAGVRRAALLALLEQNALRLEEVMPFRLDEDAEVAEVAALRLARSGRKAPPVLALEPPPCNFSESVIVELRTGIENTEIRYTLDGTVPSASSPSYSKPLQIDAETTIRAALYREGKRIGPLLAGLYHKLTEADRRDQLLVYQIKTRDSFSRYRVVYDGLAPGSRDYGVLVANPFGPRAGGQSRTVVKKGEPLRLRFGVLVHSSGKEEPLDRGAVYQRCMKLMEK